MSLGWKSYKKCGILSKQAFLFFVFGVRKANNILFSAKYRFQVQLVAARKSL